MRTRNRLSLAAFLLGALAPLHAVVTDADIQADAKAMADAVSLRADIAGRIANGSANPVASVAKLLTTARASGLKIEADADFAFAAVDIGERLIASGKNLGAELFFREAEKALDRLVKKTPDTAPAEKAQYLSALARIRINFLNNPVQAKADLDAALKLRPADKFLGDLRSSLGSEHGDVFKDQPRG
jgi:hypothetical protein